MFIILVDAISNLNNGSNECMRGCNVFFGREGIFLKFDPNGGSGVATYGQGREFARPALCPSSLPSLFNHYDIEDHITNKSATHIGLSKIARVLTSRKKYTPRISCFWVQGFLLGMILADGIVRVKTVFVLHFSKMASKVMCLRGKCTDPLLLRIKQTSFVLGFFKCDFQLARYKR